MKKYLKISIIILFIFVGVFLLYKILKKKKENNTKESKENKDGLVNNFSIGCKYRNNEFPLKKCESGGSNVEDLQRVINDIFFKVNPTNTLSVDGKFGPKTERALKSITGKKEITKQEFDSIKEDSSNTSKVMSVYYPLISEEYNLPGYHTVSKDVQELIN